MSASPYWDPVRDGTSSYWDIVRGGSLLSEGSDLRCGVRYWDPVRES